jgi:hypothetical protein
LCHQPRLHPTPVVETPRRGVSTVPKNDLAGGEASGSARCRGPAGRTSERRMGVDPGASCRGNSRIALRAGGLCHQPGLHPRPFVETPRRGVFAVPRMILPVARQMGVRAAGVRSGGPPSGGWRGSRRFLWGQFTNCPARRGLCHQPRLRPRPFVETPRRGVSTVPRMTSPMVGQRGALLPGLQGGR